MSDGAPPVTTDGETLLRVSSSSPPQSVAAAISKCIADGNYPTLRAIGHGAVGQAVKALAIARGYVAPRGIDIVFIAGFDTVESNDGSGKEISAITFRVLAR
jgi:stage V sporulation protein S